MPIIRLGKITETPEPRAATRELVAPSVKQRLASLRHVFG
jgi:hypothetical protein